MAEHFDFRRVVLGLHHQSARSGLQLAIDVARLLRLDVFGFFVKDESLGRLAALPFARELRPLGGGWHPIDGTNLSRELDLAADAAQHLFDQSTARLGLPSKFEVVSGSLPDKLASLAREGDIVVVCEPANAAGLGALSLPSLVQAAFASAAAVMLGSQAVRWRQGPIVAIARGADDPSVDVAAGIAAITTDELIVVEAGCSQSSEGKHIGRLQMRRVSVDAPSPEAPEIPVLLESLRARLVVLNREAYRVPAAAALALRLNIPLIFIDPRTIGGPH